jgi:HEAT repeat protein
MFSVEELAAKLGDPDPLARRSAAGLLCDMAFDRADITAAISALAKALSDEDAGVRKNAADAFWTAAVLGVDISPAASALLKALSDDDLDSRSNIRQALIKIGQAAVPALVDGLSGENKSVSANAADVLGKMAAANPGDAGVVKAVPALIAALNDWMLTVQYQAAKALGSIATANPGNEDVAKAIPALVQMLDEQEWSARAEATEALIHIGVPAIPALIVALNDKGVFGRSQAAGALRSIAKKNPESPGAMSALPALVAALGDEHPDVGIRAAAALGDFAAANMSILGIVVPALVKALNDGKPNVRVASADALIIVIDACDMGTFAEFEKHFSGGVRALRDSARREDLGNAMPTLTQFANRIAMKKNELARAGADGLLLDEKPKPPKGGTMFQVTRRALANG